MPNKHKLDNYLAQNKKKHLIFDLDETIMRLELPWDNFINKAWEIFERLDPEMVKQHPHPPTRTNNMINLMVEKHGEDAKKDVLTLLEDFERNELSGLTFNQPLMDWLEENKSNFKYHIWTSQMSSSAKNVLEQAKLDGLFDSVISRDMVKFTKPYPDGFLQIKAQFPAEISEYLMIGDSEFDELAAQNAGIDFFLEDFFHKTSKWHKA